MGTANLALQAEIYPKAKAALDKALALDPDLAEAHGIVAYLEFWIEWNWTAAEKSFGRVLALNPGDASVRGNYAWLLLITGRFEESLVEIKRALASDPLMPLLYAYSIGLHWVAGRSDEALADFARVQQIEPNFGLAHFQAGSAYLRKGLIDKAIETLQKSRQLFAPPGWAESGLVICYLRKDDRKTAEKILAQLLEDRKRLPVSAASLAVCFAALGDLTTAFEWLEKAIQERDTLAPVVPSYANDLLPELARDPRFAAYVDRLGLRR
jgi:serine/threonine-protein kinase